MRKFSIHSINHIDMLESHQTSKLEHALAHANSTKELVRYLIVKHAVWTIFVVISFCIAVWQIWELMAYFLASPHYVSNSFFKNEATPVFPPVTVCNFNRANKTKVNMINWRSVSSYVSCCFFYSKKMNTEPIFRSAKCASTIF